MKTSKKVVVINKIENEKVAMSEVQLTKIVGGAPVTRPVTGIRCTEDMVGC